MSAKRSITVKTALIRCLATTLVYIHFLFPKTASYQRIKTLLFRVFSALAPHYNQFTKLTGVRYETALEALIEDLKKHKFSAVNMLDLATGTGKGALYVARQFPNITVLGLDFVSGMVEVARKEAESKNLKNVRFKVGDSENTGEPSDAYDFVMTMNAPVYWAEMTRLTRAGGIIAFIFSLPYAKPLKKMVLKRLEGIGVSHRHFIPAQQGFAAWGLMQEKKEDASILKV